MPQRLLGESTVLFNFIFYIERFIIGSTPRESTPRSTIPPARQASKTSNLFTVEFLQLLQIFWERYGFNSQELYYLHSRLAFKLFTLKNEAFMKQDFSDLGFPNCAGFGSRIGDNDGRSKSSCSNAVLCVRFTW